MTPRSKTSVAPVATVAWLLGASGFCALLYQTVWMRMFRLLFGASTAATAATLAVFMAGLGLGGWLWSKAVERHPRPLALYSHLELAISGLALVSVFSMDAVTWLYHATGGSQALGTFGATALRLLLAVVVMGPSVLLMGATLPAAARAVTREEDEARSPVAILLGANTVGAFLGVWGSTFFLLEVLGTRTTFFVAVLLNLLVGIVARAQARELISMSASETSAASATAAEASASPRQVPLSFVLLASATVGLAFMLMELVWYRMLGPILGGSTYTFGVVLAVALIGMGLGGFAYALYAQRRIPKLNALAATCALEALCLLFPYALGDQLALVSLFLRPLGQLGFSWMVLTWFMVASVVVLPMALVAGFQFPLLISLLGKGHREVGQEVAWAYAANTFGSIVGSLAGGFGLIPGLTAVGVWKWTGVCLLALGALAWLLHQQQQSWQTLGRTAWVAVVWLVAAQCLRAEGPTAVWRHSAIGAGRSDTPASFGANGLRDWIRQKRAQVFWEKDGVESSVAMSYGPGIAFFVNGKSDGSAFGDSGTQVMGGLLGAALHPQPKTSLVVGLGTGSTAGWLAQVPTMQKVDVAEIEPVILEVASACADVNHHVLDNPKVKVHLEDAREWLMTSREKYDVVFSEPSNPYRAGIASLYTLEFYQAVKSRLHEDGVLLQWLQAYEVDSATVRTVLTTLRSVFPHVDVWQTLGSDLVLRASMKKPQVDVAELRQKLAQFPYVNAMRAVWRTEGVEGFLSHFIADDALIQHLISQNPEDSNTDDRNQVEFAFAKTVGVSQLFSPQQLWQAAVSMKRHNPSWISGDLNWDELRVERAAIGLLEKGTTDAPHLQRRLQWVSSKSVRKELLNDWKSQNFEAKSRREKLLLAMALAQEGEEQALSIVNDGVEEAQVETALVRARLRLMQKRNEEAMESLVEAFTSLRQQIWLAPEVDLETTARSVIQAAARQPALIEKLWQALETSFPAKNLELLRREMRVNLAEFSADVGKCKVAYRDYEPQTPWRLGFLKSRSECYSASHDEFKSQAQKDLEEFMAHEPNTSFLSLQEAAP